MVCRLLEGSRRSCAEAEMNAQTLHWNSCSTAAIGVLVLKCTKRSHAFALMTSLFPLL